MKEFTKTIVKKYNSEGKLIEHTETVVEKENGKPVIPDYPSYPAYPVTPTIPTPPWNPTSGNPLVAWGDILLKTY